MTLQEEEAESDLNFSAGKDELLPVLYSVWMPLKGFLPMNHVRGRRCSWAPVPCLLIKSNGPDLQISKVAAPIGFNNCFAKHESCQP